MCVFLACCFLKRYTTSLWLPRARGDNRGGHAHPAFHPTPCAHSSGLGCPVGESLKGRSPLNLGLPAPRPHEQRTPKPEEATGKLCCGSGSRQHPGPELGRGPALPDAAAHTEPARTLLPCHRHGAGFSRTEDAGCPAASGFPRFPRSLPSLVPDPRRLWVHFFCF